jgi:hypothetical protein
MGVKKSNKNRWLEPSYRREMKAKERPKDA